MDSPVVIEGHGGPRIECSLERIHGALAAARLDNPLLCPYKDKTPEWREWMVGYSAVIRLDKAERAATEKACLQVLAGVDKIRKAQA